MVSVALRLQWFVRSRGNAASLFTFVITIIATLILAKLLRDSGNWYLARTGSRFVTIVGFVTAFGILLAPRLKTLSHSKPKMIALFGVMIPASIFQMFSNPLVTTGDTLPVLPTVVQMLRHGNRDLSAYCEPGRFPRWETHSPRGQRYYVRQVEGRSGVYSSYPAGMELFAAPVVIAAMALELNHDDDTVLARLERLTAALLTGASLALFYLIALKRGSPTAAYVTTMLLATGSPFASTLGLSLWQQGGVCFWMLVVLAVEVHRPRGTLVFQAFAMAMMLTCRPSALLFLFPFVIWQLNQDWRRALKISLFAVVCYLPWAMVYLNIYGSPFGPSMTMLNENWILGEHVVGVLFSPSRGLFVYQYWLVMLPLIAFAVTNFSLHSEREVSTPRGSLPRRVNTPRSEEIHTLRFPLLSFVILHTLLISSWPTWWGGHCYGSRLMAETVPVLALLIVPFVDSLIALRWGRVMMILIFVLNLAMHMPGSHGTAMAWNFSPTEIDTDRERLWDWQNPPFLDDIQNPK